MVPRGWFSRALGLLAILQALVLIGCSGQAVVPPVDISSTAGAKQIPGNYAVTVQTGAWTLKTTTDRSICAAWTFDTALDDSYSAAIRSALKHVLERVTFVPDVMSPQQIRARGFDAQIIIGQGDANSTFTVPVYAITGTAHGSIELSVTVSIRQPAGQTASQETVSARGSGRAEISRCSGAATAISASARNALGTVTRGIVRSLQQRLDIRTANRAPARPSAPAKVKETAESDAPAADAPAAKEAEKPEVVPAADERIAATPKAAPEATPAEPEVQVAVVPRPVDPGPARSRARSDSGPLSPEQAFQRGVAAVEGRGVRKSDTEAVRWFRMAADQGYAPAQNNLGFMYAEGRGVSRDDQTAVEWYRRAADAGYAPAQTSLAMMVQAGRGVPRNDVLALALYSAASSQGYAPATANVGQMFTEGRGTKRDEDTGAFLIATSGEAPRSGSGIFVDGQ